MTRKKSLLALILSTALATTLLAAPAYAADNPFATATNRTYVLADADKAGEAKCGAGMGGTAKCGAMNMEAEPKAKKAAHKKARKDAAANKKMMEEGKCGEGKCGTKNLKEGKCGK